MNRRVAFGIACVLAFTAQAARAQSFDAKQPTYALGLGGSITIIWRDRAAFVKMLKLANAGASMKALLPLAACGTPIGSRIVVTDGDQFGSTVTVIGGPQDACEGFLPNKLISNDPKAKVPGAEN